MADPIFFRDIQFAAKNEGTEGTEETLTNANIIRVSNCSFVPGAEMEDRNLSDLSISSEKSLFTNRSATISFDVELKGSGNAAKDVPPEYSPLLKSCGFGETIDAGVSVVYAPISANIPTLTIHIFTGGLKYRFWGCRGTLTASFPAGKAASLSFTFMAANWDVEDGAKLTGGSYDNVIPPIIVNGTFSFDSLYRIGHEINIDIGNTVAPRTSINAASGKLSYIITRRRVTGSMSIELVLVATYDFHTKWEAGTEVPLVWQVNGDDGNNITVSCPTVSLTALDSTGDAEGIRMLSAEFEVNGNDNEITFTYE